MALLIRDLPGYIQDKLRERRGTLKAQEPKSAWFRFTSNASPAGQPSGQILQGGSFAPDNSKFGNLRAGFDGQYDFSEGNAARPEPGAQSASVTVKGSDLSASVDWKCWTPNQLEELAPYFLTPGISVILEMGWSTITGTQLGAMVNVNDVPQRRELYRNKPPKGSKEAQQAEGEDPIYTLDGRGGPQHPIPNRRERGGGNYDLFVGQIGDFSIEYNDSGGFDCTTEIVGTSTSIIAIRAVDQKTRNNDDAGGSEEAKKPSFFEFVAERNADSPSGEGAPAVIDHVKEQDVGAGNWAAVGGVEYLSWEAIEQEILNPFVSYRNNEVKGQHVMSWDSSNTEVSYFPEMLSTEPLVCAVVPSKTLMPSGEDSGGVLRGFTEGSERDSPKRGPLYNLYVSKDTVTTTVKNNKNSTIGDIVLRILEKCSSACFDIWDFTIQEEMNNLKVVDRNATGVVDDNDNIFTFRPYTTDTVVDSFNIDAKLDDLVKSQVLVGSRIADSGRDKDHEVNGGAGGGMVDLFGKVDDPVFPRGFENPAEKRSSPEENPNEGGGTPQRDVGDPNKADLYNENSARFATLPPNLSYISIDGYKSIIPTPEKARELRQKIRKDTGEDSPINANRNLPIDVSLEFKGVGGIAMYQSFDVANLPKSLNQGIFMVKEVEHTVSDSEWKTSIKGQYRTTNQFEGE